MGSTRIRVLCGLPGASKLYSMAWYSGYARGISPSFQTYRRGFLHTLVPASETALRCCVFLFHGIRPLEKIFVRFCIQQSFSAASYADNSDSLFFAAMLCWLGYALTGTPCSVYTALSFVRYSVRRCCDRLFRCNCLHPLPFGSVGAEKVQEFRRTFRRSGITALQCARELPKCGGRRKDPQKQN